MARTRLPLQQDLISDAWRISRVREDVETLLEHVVSLQSQVVALAGAYGVKQIDLASVTSLSRQRVGQLLDQVDAGTLNKESLEAQIHQVEEWPQDVMSALQTLKRGPADDDAEFRERIRSQVAVVHGQEEADRRYEARTAFLASLSSDPERRAQVDESAARARRTVFGTEG